MKPSGATHTSIFSAIHPALAAALSQDEKTPDKKQDKGRIQNINYSSAPLKGTEGRDRSSVGLSESMLNNQDMSPFHQRGSSIHKQTSRGSNLHTASSEDSADVSNLNMSEDLMIAKRKSSTEGNSAKQRDAYGTSDVSMSAKTESDLDSSSQEASSESVDDNTPQTKDEGKKEDIISSTAGQIWQNLFSRVKNTMNSLKHPKKTLNPTPKSERQENETRGEYTETDVHNMLHDIMQEIQMKNDKKGHRRGQNSNWNTNEVTRNEDGEKSMGGETKLLMTTKILVTPKIVAEAVRTSTKNMLHLRDQALSRTAAAKLLTEVQIKLAELLEPADTYASDNSIKPQEKLNGKDGVGSD